MTNKKIKNFKMVENINIAIIIDHKNKIKKIIILIIIKSILNLIFY